MASEAPTSAEGAAAKAADAPPVPLHSGAELLAACKSSDAGEAMRLLGVAGIDVNAKDEEYGMTPLHHACEKGLKEVYASKGPASTRPCLSCLNVVQFLDHVLEEDGYLVSVKCPHPARFVKSSDANVFEAADRLKRAKAHMTKAAFEHLEQELGLHNVPGGILYDDHCRSLVRPVTGWYRDWMHVMAVAGCGNIELEQIIHGWCICTEKHRL